ncbi:hypothetical protein [Streptomyces sp. DW26H14]|uniref:hypothetical protein n=1 Tax=Streptomyces sp. DW26H14 TaxID=3435395 RepID=UPI00403DB4AE
MLLVYLGVWAGVAVIGAIDAPSSNDTASGLPGDQPTVPLALLVAFGAMILCGGMVTVLFYAAVTGTRHDRTWDLAFQLQTERLESEFRERKEQLYVECEDWKARTTAELYETILGQAERGVLKPRYEVHDDFPDDFR